MRVVPGTRAGLAAHAPASAGRSSAVLPSNTGSRRLLTGLGANDKVVLVRLVPPVAGGHVGSGPNVTIPSDWLTRLQSGEDVTGCGYLRAEADGTLDVRGDYHASLVAGLADQSLRDGCNATHLAAFEVRWNAGQAL